MRTPPTPKRLPVISIVLFVLAGAAFLLCLYFVFAAFSAPAAVESYRFLLASFGALGNMLVGMLKQAVSGVMALLAGLHGLIGALLLAMGLVARSHRDLAARVAELEARAAGSSE